MLAEQPQVFSSRDGVARQYWQSIGWLLLRGGHVGEQLIDLGNFKSRKRNVELSFPKIPSGLDSHRKTESSHHSDQWLRSCMRS
jgi:hypothetical protein